MTTQQFPTLPTVTYTSGETIFQNADGPKPLEASNEEAVPFGVGALPSSTTEQEGTSPSTFYPPATTIFETAGGGVLLDEDRPQSSNATSVSTTNPIPFSGVPDALFNGGVPNELSGNPLGVLPSPPDTTLLPLFAPITEFEGPLFQPTQYTPQAPQQPPSPAFLPTSIPGLAVWYRADMLVSTVSGAVSGWGDSSGSADPNKNLSQPTAINRPTFNFVDPAYNNQPTLSFLKASSQFMASGLWAISIPGSVTIFVVGNDDAAPSTDLSTAESYFDGFGQLSNSDSIFWSGAHNAVIGTVELDGTAPGSTFPKILAGILNGASSSIYESSATPSAIGDTGARPNGLSGATLGQLEEGGGFFLNGKIAEVLVYAGALTPAQISQAVSYLSARYAIALH